MVATDVASRGIGMIEPPTCTPFALPIAPVGIPWLCDVKICSLQMCPLQLLLSGPGLS